jgi:hypothetical protein
VNVQAGLDPCWSQTRYVGFVVLRLISELKYDLTFLFLYTQKKICICSKCPIICTTQIIISEQNHNSTIDGSLGIQT